MDTKTVNTYQVSLAEFGEMLKNKEGIFEELSKAVAELLKDRWVFMENKEVFYDNEVVALYPDLNHYKCTFIDENNCPISKVDKSVLNFAGFKGDFMTINERKKSFNKRINFPFKYGSDKIKYNGSDANYRMAYRKKSDTLAGYDMDDDSYRDQPGIVMPIYRLYRKDSDKLGSNQVLLLWLQHELIPQGLSKEHQENYKQLIDLQIIDLVKTGAIKIANNKITFVQDKLEAYAKENKLQDEIKSDTLIDKLLNGDKYRANIESYDEKILTDPNRGHWELWQHEQYQNPVELELEQEFVARDPRADIKDGGVVGIDFGTKSTVVVHQEDSVHTLPMRVGVGEFSKEVGASHYENPTVMEFKDLESFLSDYQAKKSRPATSWEDLTVSHTAFKSLMNSSSDYYYSILTGLKQWAGNKERRLRLKDQDGKDLTLPAFLELEEDDLNPIELYAYYLGLYINNQHNGVYLDYILSFPVSYEKEVRSKILTSFKRGLKKSLPLALYDDQEVMNRFRVSSGASEPAAYAICALQEYGFEPFEDEAVFYGIFDFGGGTTDFDFGIWRGANMKERRYDFVIEHFGAEGYEYLGGENLLELLAFEVFKSNQEKLRQTEISFTLPPKCKKFPGSETLLNNSQEAKLNMKQLMEKLRPLWERHEDYENLYSKGIVKINLFDKTGKEHTNVELAIDQKELEGKLRARIEEGVVNFFDALRRSFEEPLTKSVEKVNIFLAGNSSKSEIVQELFEEYIAQEVEGILGKKDSDKELYEVFPPLGTEEAYAKQEERDLEVAKDDIKRPTGKTGVAFGLVDGRKGGRIKVINNNIKEDEAKFKYFIGMNRRRRFFVIVDRDTEYQKWYNFIDAGEEDFELYYTSVPEASRNQLDISEAQRKKCRIDTINDQAFVYIRAVKPTVIEYVVASEEGIKSGEYLSEVKELELN
ncbi:hypothetical protein MWH25_02360 [Natroniella acetigena]|uniref:hypothetical protein n=1 Tax=Natroniella acetigena TaxID=52004 RepID=UPI00200A084E|nr:hypothetical protein [Natroniella acetigena]MCK8826592.1 hypothetical protein [Natroniella acetigena]